MKQRLLVAAVGVPLTVIVILFAPRWLFNALMAILFAACVWELLRSGWRHWYCWAIVPLIVWAAVSLIVQRSIIPPYLLLLPIGCAYIGDAGAMLCGKFIGPHIGGGHPFPKISPNKTWAGMVGGLVVPALYALVFVLVTGIGNLLYWLLYALLLGLAAECGDLFFSAVKRRLGIKDYGNLLPGHGGVLDRFDSMIFVAPVSAIMFWVIVIVTYHATW